MNRSIIFMMDYRGDQLQIGGTSNYLKLLAPRVRDCGFEVRVAIPYSHEFHQGKTKCAKSGLIVEK